MKKFCCGFLVLCLVMFATAFPAFAGERGGALGVYSLAVDQLDSQAYNVKFEAPAAIPAPASFLFTVVHVVLTEQVEMEVVGSSAYLIACGQCSPETNKAASGYSLRNVGRDGLHGSMEV